MTPETTIKVRNGRNGIILAVSVVLGGVGGSAGGQYLWLSRADIKVLARPDPFTGTEGIRLRADLNGLQRQIDAKSTNIAVLEREVELLRAEMNRRHVQ